MRFQAAVLLIVCALAGACVGRGAEGTEAGAELVAEGLDLQSKNQPAEAARAYREALVHDPDNKFAWYNLGLIEQQAGRPAVAELYYRHALIFDPGMAPALFNLAILLSPTRADEAVRLYRRLIELQPNYAAAHLNLGFLLRDLKRVDEGNKELETAVRLDPSLRSRVGPSSTPAPAPSGN